MFKFNNRTDGIEIYVKEDGYIVELNTPHGDITFTRLPDSTYMLPEFGWKQPKEELLKVLMNAAPRVPREVLEKALG